MFSKLKRVEIIFVVATLLIASLASIILSKPEPTSSNIQNPILVKGEAKVSIPTTTELDVKKPKSYPENPPSDPYEKVSIKQIATIEIPKVGLNQPVYVGVSLTILDKGPGYWPGSSLPGEFGNLVIAGHRVTHSKPFNKLDLLSAGDEIIITSDTGRHVYKYRETKIVQPEDIWIVNQTNNHQLTMFACHPKGSAKQRIVVFADLVSTPVN